MSARASAAAAWCLRPANRRVGLALSRKKKTTRGGPLGQARGEMLLLHVGAPVTKEQVGWRPVLAHYLALECRS